MVHRWITTLSVLARFALGVKATPGVLRPDIVIGPYYPSICASAVSAWGSQNVMSMARYNAMAAPSSA